MIIPALCPICNKEGVHEPVKVGNFEINDTGRYDIICNKGHESILLTQQERFQILFEIGIYAIIDGYYREAVSSITSSLERFYEFYCKVICLSKGIIWSSIQDTWKLISSQSERQLGAYVFLHLLSTNQPPQLLHKKKIEFRNKVIHNGKIPTKEEAIDYGQAVLDLIRPLLIELRNNHEVAVDYVIGESLKQKRGSDNKGRTVSTMYKSSILSLDIIDPTHYEMSMNDAIKMFEIYRPVR